LREKLITISKFVSLVLRHRPDKIGLKIDHNGWADVSELIEKSRKLCDFNLSELQEVVAENEKKRFMFNNDKTLIRASQGHSIDVDLQLKPAIPPDVLYHGTSRRFLTPILKEGLKKMNRNHVHLSSNVETAISVGSRHDRRYTGVIILVIDVKGMLRAGHVFYRSDNGVWLTDNVPAEYLKLKKE